jgi:prepilin-type N-terminal cleavage/methylation domain-containing protein
MALAAVEPGLAEDVMKTRRKHRSQSGFTLIEVVIALGLLAFTLLGVMGMQFYAMRGNTYSLGTTNALNLAQDHMESLLAQPYNSAALTAGTISTPVADARGDTYTRQTVITDNVVPPSTVTTKTIRVTVLWGPSNSRQCSLTSIVRPQGN